MNGLLNARGVYRCDGDVNILIVFVGENTDYSNK